MSKVTMWKTKMDLYYKNVPSENFKSDLKKSGFKLTQDSIKIGQLGDFHRAFAEVAAGRDIFYDDENVYYSDEDLVDSQPDKAVAVKLR
jgi:hypothetical protein